MLLSILMPVYNEQRALSACVERVCAARLPDGMTREIVMVEDCSTDGTRELVGQIAAKRPELIRPFFQPRNMGKGAAIRRAIAEMRGERAAAEWHLTGLLPLLGNIPDPVRAQLRQQLSKNLRPAFDQMVRDQNGGQ